MEIYPSYTMVFVIFNLLGWWFKGQPFFSWWWILPVWIFQIITEALILAITKRMIQIKDRPKF